MESHEWRCTVGAQVRRRREDLGIPSIRAAADLHPRLTEGTWRQIENATKGVPSPSRRTQFAVAEVLAWPQDWLDQLLAGEEVSSPLPRREEPLEARVARLEQAVAELLRQAVGQDDATGPLPLPDATGESQ
jgi:hypothetical protein